MKEKKRYSMERELHKVVTGRVLALRAAKLLNISQKDMDSIFKLWAELIRKTVLEGEAVLIRGLGTFFLLTMRGKVSKTFKHHEKLGTDYYYRRFYFTPDKRIKKVIRRMDGKSTASPPETRD